MPLCPSKQQLRLATRDKVRLLTEADRSAGSKSILERLFGTQLWKQSRSVLLFAPIKTEPDISAAIGEAIALGKTTCLPRWNGEEYEVAAISTPSKDLIRGAMNILEPGRSCQPFDGKRLDLVLVPGVAWTSDGCRLGRGKGHYDRLLSNCSGIHCGIGWDEQLVTEMPMESHDRKVHMLITPGGSWSGGLKISD